MVKQRAIMRMVSIGWIVFAGAWTAHPCETLGQEKARSDEAILDEMYKVWGQQQARVRSAKVVTKVHQRIPQHAYTRIKRDTRETYSWPDKDLVLDWNEEIAIDGEKMRWNNNRPEVRSDKGTITPRKQVITFNGVECKSIKFKEDGSPVEGSIRTEKSVGELQTAGARPLLFALRPLNTELTWFRRDRSTFLRDRPIANGRLCVTIRIESNGITMQVTADPSRNYAVVRQVLLQNDKPQFEMNVVHQPHSALGWVPASWNSGSLNSDGSIRNAMGASLVSIDVNPAIDASNFEITFPTGAQISDEKGKRETIVNQAGELETTVIWASAEKDQAPYMVYVIAGVVLLACILAVVFVRRGKGHRIGS